MLPNDVRRAWADRCGLAWDESDDRVREPEKYGWPHDFEIFYAGWKASYTTAQELVPESSGLPWTGDVQGRRPASCAPSEMSPPTERITFDDWWNKQDLDLPFFYACREAWQTALAEGKRRALADEDPLRDFLVAQAAPAHGGSDDKRAHGWLADSVREGQQGPAPSAPILEALILAQIVLRRWTELYAKLQNECGEVVSRKLDYNLPPADHVRALESIAAALEHVKALPSVPTSATTPPSDAEERIVSMIRYVGVKAGVAEATYGAMCHEVRCILRSSDRTVVKE
jgi:hypothetical protein